MAPDFEKWSDPFPGEDRVCAPSDPARFPIPETRESIAMQKLGALCALHFPQLADEIDLVIEPLQFVDCMVGKSMPAEQRLALTKIGAPLNLTPEGILALYYCLHTYEKDYLRDLKSLWRSLDARYNLVLKICAEAETLLRLCRTLESDSSIHPEDFIRRARSKCDQFTAILNRSQAEWSGLMRLRHPLPQLAPGARPSGYLGIRTNDRLSDHVRAVFETQVLDWPVAELSHLRTYIQKHSRANSSPTEAAIAQAKEHIAGVVRLLDESLQSTFGNESLRMFITNPSRGKRRSLTSYKRLPRLSDSV